MLPLLVTGGCGFIGSNYVRQLLDADPDISIINFDALTYAGNPANLADLAGNPRYRFVHGDITDKSAVRRALNGGACGIVNFAAESHVDRSILDSGPFVRTNVVGTQILLDAAREFDGPRFLQVSTDEVYGSLGPTGVFREDTPLAPSRPYSASKAAADMLVQAYHHTFGLNVVVTRCSNNYGAYQFPHILIPLFITNRDNDIQLSAYADAIHPRDWIHVRDQCHGIESVRLRARAGQVYTLGGKNARANLEITTLLLDLIGKPKS